MLSSSQLNICSPLTALLSLILCLTACTSTKVLPNKENSPTAIEIKANIEGRQAYNLIISKYSLYDNSALQGYVQRIGEHLAARSRKHDLIYRFSVIETEGTETFSLPGGYVFVSRGALTYLNDENDLAALLAHELAHIELDDANRPIIEEGSSHEKNASAAISIKQPSADTIIDAVKKAFSGERELEIHRRAAQLLAASGYETKNIASLLHVFRRFADYEQQVSAVTDHSPLLGIYHPVLFLAPKYEEKLESIITESQKIPMSGPPRLNREDFLTLIDGVTYGKNVEETENGKIYFNEAGFSLILPKDWKISAEVDPISFEPYDQTALIELQVISATQRISLLKLLEKKYSLKSKAEAKAIKFGGIDAYTLIANIETDLGAEKARLLAFNLKDKTVIFVGTAVDENAFSDKDKIFIKVIQSLKILSKTKPPRKNLRIKVIKADNKLSFEQLAKQSSVKEWRLRLLNQESAQGEPTPGQLIKTVQ